MPTIGRIVDSLPIGTAGQLEFLFCGRMDWKCMTQFVSDTITQDLKELESRQDLLDEIKYSFDEEFLDELLDNVTTVTYGLAEGETLSFPVHDPTK